MRLFESIVEQAAQVDGEVRIGAMTHDLVSGQPVHAGCSGSGTRTRSGSWAPGSDLLASARGVLSRKICAQDFFSVESPEVGVGGRKPRWKRAQNTP